MTENPIRSIVKKIMTDLSAKRLSAYIAIFLSYITAWADIIFAIPQPTPFSALWFIVSVLKNAVRIAFMLYIAAQMQLFRTKRWRSALRRLPSGHELRKALSVMLLSVACAGLGVVISWLTGAVNPLFAYHRYQPAALLLPFILLSSISVGYAEELFFRFFLIDGLVEAGTAPHAAAIASILIFAISHSAQGISGVAFAGVLATFYTSLRYKGYGIHELALGHAMYDAIVLVIALV